MTSFRRGDKVLVQDVGINDEGEVDIVPYTGTVEKRIEDDLYSVIVDEHLDKREDKRPIMQFADEMRLI